MSQLFILFCFLANFSIPGALRPLPLTAQVVAAENLTVEEVVNLTRAKFSEEIIITKIKKNGKPFDLSTEELLDLKKEGVSENVIKYLLDPALPYAPPEVLAPKTAPQAVTGTPPKQYPADSFASLVPQEPGLYSFFTNSLSKVDLKFLLGNEEAKTLMKKAKTIAYLVGPTSSTHVNTPSPVLYVRLPEGKEIEELVLVCLTVRNGRREILFATKQELKAEDMRQRSVLEVGPKLYRVTPAKLDPGEYLLFFIGSAEAPKGVFGKGYDFSVNAAAPPKDKASAK